MMKHNNQQRTQISMRKRWGRRGMRFKRTYNEEEKEQDEEEEQS